MHERVYIHILALVGMAVKRTFDATVRRVCVEVFGDTFQGFLPTETKSYPRMVAKLLSRSDHRDETLRPRPALNVDVVRCLVSVPVTGDIEPFLACLARATGGFIKAKNNYLCPPEELRKLFHLRLVLATIRLNAGRTFGQLCRDPAVQDHAYFCFTWGVHMVGFRCAAKGRSPGNSGAQDIFMRRTQYAVGVLKCTTTY